MIESDGKPDTKQRILDTAERLFAQQGLAGTSLRHIIAQAGVNLAAIHYHYRSKETLIESVIRRRVEQVNAERLAMLDAFEAQGTPSVAQVLEAFIAPTVRVAADPSRGGPAFVRLIGRVHLEGGDLLARIFQRHFGDMLRRFGNALRRALPGVTDEELYWRTYMAAGAMSHTLRGADELKTISGGLCNPSDFDKLTHRLVTFLAAGFCAEFPPHDRK